MDGWTGGWTGGWVDGRHRHAALLTVRLDLTHGGITPISFLAFGPLIRRELQL